MRNLTFDAPCLQKIIQHTQGASLGQDNVHKKQTVVRFSIISKNKIMLSMKVILSLKTDCDRETSCKLKLHLLQVLNPNASKIVTVWIILLTLQNACIKSMQVTEKRSKHQTLMFFMKVHIIFSKLDENIFSITFLI
jgi:hypothetical protein